MNAPATKSPKDALREFFRAHYNRMLRHVHRLLRQEEMTGEIPRGTLDPRDIVHEVARQAERSADKKPARVSWIVWLFHLLHEELRRQLPLLRQEQVEDIPTEKRTTLPELRLSALQPMEQMVERIIEPEAIRIEDIVPNPEALPPDQAVEEKELLDHLEQSIKTWPQIERHVFELYFVQGFEPEAISQIISCPVKQVKETVAEVHARLRKELLREEIVT